METTPRCEVCGKFIELDPETRGVEWDGRLVWTGYPTPEPSHDEFWHIECANKEVKERTGGMNSKSRERKDHDPSFKLQCIMGKTIKDGECLVWTGSRFYRKKGERHKPEYPCISFKGKTWRGNRLVLFLVTGRIPDGLLSLHKCDNSMCVNPEHLYWGTYEQNVKDTYDRKRARNAKVTHCPRGHHYAGDNLRVKDGARYCRKCSAIKSQMFRDKKKGIL